MCGSLPSKKDPTGWGVHRDERTAGHTDSSVQKPEIKETEGKKVTRAFTSAGGETGKKKNRAMGWLGDPGWKKRKKKNNGGRGRKGK